MAGGDATTFSWRDLLRGMGSWLRHNLPQALVMSAISFAFGWVVNFWVMAFRWDGFRAPAGESDYIAAQNSLVSGSLFWAALTSFLFAAIAYGHQAGWGQLRQEVFSLPSRIGAMFRGAERNRSLTTLCWALALSLLLALVISPGVAAVAAGFFLVFAATPLGDLLSGVVRRLWVDGVARLAPHKGAPSSEVGAAAVTAAGMVAGFVVAATVDIFLLKVLAVVVAALAAYYFANEDDLGPAGGTAVFLLIAAAVGLYELFEAGLGVALADDGGWSECGDCNIIDYITSTGATEVVSRSTVAGAGAGVGAPIGAAVGSSVGSGGGRPRGGGPDAPGGDDLLGSIGGGEGGGQSGGQGGSSPEPTGGGEGTMRTAGDVTPVRTRSDAAPDAAAPPPDSGGTDDTTPAPPPPGDGTSPPPPPAGTPPPDAPPAPDAQGDDLLGSIGGGEGSVDTPTPDDAAPPQSGGGTAEVRRRPPPDDAPPPPPLPAPEPPREP